MMGEEEGKDEVEEVGGRSRRIRRRGGAAWLSCVSLLGAFQILSSPSVTGLVSTATVPCAFQLVHHLALLNER